MLSSPDYKPEVWMRGALPNIHGLLQPVAHALLQTEEDILKYTRDLDNDLLWIKPYGHACIAFHLQHITGVIDRMFTYAQNLSLSQAQFDFLASEGKQQPTSTLHLLVQQLQRQIKTALLFLETVPADELTQARFLGRKRIPTTLIGLLFHAAEHAQRHVGQLLVTVSSIRHSVGH